MDPVINVCTDILVIVMTATMTAGFGGLVCLIGCMAYSAFTEGL